MIVSQIQPHPDHNECHLLNAQLSSAELAIVHLERENDQLRADIRRLQFALEQIDTIREYAMPVKFSKYLRKQA